MGIKIPTPFSQIDCRVAAGHSKPRAIVVTVQGHISDGVIKSVWCYVRQSSRELFHQLLNHDNNLMSSGNSFSLGRFSSRLTDDSSSGII